jgi:hypothetical protein
VYVCVCVCVLFLLLAHPVQQLFQAQACIFKKEGACFCLQLAAGGGLDEGRFRPKGWRPFCAHEWLAHYLLAHKPEAGHIHADLGTASGSTVA